MGSKGGTLVKVNKGIITRTRTTRKPYLVGTVGNKATLAKTAELLESEMDIPTNPKDNEVELGSTSLQTLWQHCTNV